MIKITYVAVDFMVICSLILGMKMSKFKLQAQAGFSRGMDSAEKSAPNVNLFISGWMMMLGSCGFVYAAMYGPKMLILRIALLLLCAAVTFAGFNSFKTWSDKIRREKLVKEISKQTPDEVHP